MKTTKTIASKLAAIACALSIAAVPATAIAQPAATAKEAPVVAQSVCYDYSDAVLVALTDAGYAPIEATITDLDTYVNEYGVLVDYVGFNVGGMHFAYEVECLDGTIWYKDVWVL